MPGSLGAIRLVSSVVTLTDAATITVDASQGNAFKVTLTANAHVLGLPSNLSTGQRLHFTIIQDGTGGWTLVTATNYPKVTWSDTGNTLNKRSTFAVIYDGTNLNQDGAQTPYI